MTFIIIFLSFFILFGGMFGSLILTVDEDTAKKEDRTVTKVVQVDERRDVFRERSEEIKDMPDYSLGVTPTDYGKPAIGEILIVTSEINYEFVKDNAIGDDRESRWVIDGRPPVYVASGPGRAVDSLHIGSKRRL